MIKREEFISMIDHIVDDAMNAEYVARFDEEEANVLITAVAIVRNSFIAEFDRMTTEIDRLRWHEYPELPETYGNIIIERGREYEVAYFNVGTKVINFPDGDFTYAENINRWRYIE